MLLHEGDCPIFVSVSKAAPSAPWLVFSNSLMTDHGIWDEQARHFGGRFNLLRYDQRGHGRSGVPEAASFAALTADLLAALDHFEIASCTYVGLSMGVPTGLSLAGLQPGRISQMVLSDGQMATMPTGRQMWQGRIDAARKNGMGWVAKDTVQRWFAPEFIASGGADKVLASAAAMQPEGYIACATTLQDYDFTAVAAGLTIPVQLLVGSNDGAMPQTMQTMAATIPGATLRVIEGAGHIPNVEQPAAFNAAIDSLFDRIG